MIFTVQYMHLESLKIQLKEGWMDHTSKSMYHLSGYWWVYLPYRAGTLSLSSLLCLYLWSPGPIRSVYYGLLCLLCLLCV